ncbi:MAG: metallophosphoesterase [Peptococcaceae bacterium]|nr:metallophosphoesterase [Peptococcaceae bacterium]
MWGVITTVFLLLYFFMSYYIGRKGFIALGRPASGLNRTIYWVFFSLLVIPFPAAALSGNFLPETAGQWLAVWGGYSVVGVSYIFLLALLIDILRLLDRHTGFVPAAIREHKKTPPVIASLALTAVAAILAYGSWNARNPVITEYDLTVHKKAGSLQQIKIALVSDIHYGPVVDIRRVEKLAGIMNELRPDIILLAGDITEGVPRLEKVREFTGLMARMPAKLGIFAVTGNHDRGLRGNDGELLNCFKEAGINILRDNCVKIADSFYLAGRDYPRRQSGQGRKDLADLLKGIDPSMPLILLDHQPVDLEKARDCGADLQLSGHTHVGQVFPVNLITGQLYELDWGLLRRGSYHLIVSSGYGTWGPPLRVGNRPEVVSITVKFRDEGNTEAADPPP